MAYVVEWGSFLNYGWLDSFGVRFAEGAASVEPFKAVMRPPVTLFTREQVPEVAFFDGWEQYIPTFISINGFLGVTREIRDVIEELEPGQHQFFSVAIQRKDGTKPFFVKDNMPLQEPYYLLNPGVRLDAVWIEKSDVRVHQFGSSPALVHARLGMDKIVLRREVVQGHHLWEGWWQLGGKLFFSDELSRFR